MYLSIDKGFGTEARKHIYVMNELKKRMIDRMNISIDADLARTLRETALKKYGKLKGASLLIEEALRLYFKTEGIHYEEPHKSETQ